MLMNRAETFLMNNPARAWLQRAYEVPLLQRLGAELDGADVVAAVACGARACLVGRAYLYVLMAGGQRGVQRVADILTGEITRTLQLLGVRSVAELTPDRVRLRGADPALPAAAPRP